MIRQNLLLVLTTASFVVAYSILAETSLGADSVAEVATQSRQLADAGKWDEARSALEDRLSQVKEVNQIARLKAELAHYAVERNTYFQKDDGLVDSKIEDARLAVQAADTQPALATLETAEGQVTYWNALEGTNEWGPPTSHFDRAIQLYRKLGDDVGLGEATFYRGLVYQMQNQNEPARKLFDQALKLTEKTGDERIRSFVVRHIGYLQESAGEIEGARASFRESLELRQRNDMKVFAPFAMILLADFEGEQKKSGEATQYAEQAIQSARSGNSPRAVYSAQLTLAKLYLENGKPAEAKQLAEQSRAGAEAFGSAGDTKEAQDFLQKHP
jgi:tetratricopeptide (TPR) repeat protein